MSEAESAKQANRCYRLLRNTSKETRTNNRGRRLMVRSDKKGHRAVEVADPNLGGTGVE